MSGSERPRILVVGVKQETATFNPAPTTAEDFEVVRGLVARRSLHGTATEVGGVLDTGAHLAVELGTIAWAPSGGPVDAATWRALRGAILDDVEAARFDAVIVIAHGAMVCADTDDPEGDLLTTIRSMVGDRPIVATIDLHAVLTERMLTATDALVPYHTYPHVDHHETGARAVRALDRLLEGAPPTTAYTPVPALVRGDELLTATGLLGRLITRCRSAEARGALASGVIIGNPFTDVAELRSGVLVTTVDDLEIARSLSASIAADLWDSRHALRADLVGIEQSIAATRSPSGLVVLADQADATSSGAAGDAVAILRALLTTSSGRPALVTVVDAPAAAKACALGVGASSTFRLGGTVDPRHEPIDVDATVAFAHPDHVFTYEDGTIGRAGACAVLEVDGVSITVTSRAVWVVGQRVYRAVGLDPERSKVVVVKSPNGYRPYYERIATRMIPVDGVGATSAALERLPYTKLSRPTWPLDDDVTPALEPLCFRRRRP